MPRGWLQNHIHKSNTIQTEPAVFLYLGTQTQKQQQKQLKNRKADHEFERELGRVYVQGLGEGKTKGKLI